MRGALLSLLCLCLTGPAAAWDFTPVPVCTLSNSGSPDVTITFDPSAEEPYAIELSAEQPWPENPVFGLRFEGGRELTITTGRHRLTEDGTTVTVSDRGFGNVLSGLEFNSSATAFSGDTALGFSLEGAAEPVRAFRACVAAPIA